MADFDEDEDFYEEDEPAEKIHAIFDKGEKGMTWPPTPVVRIVTRSPNFGTVGPIELGFPGGQFVTGPQTVTNTTGGTMARSA
ncbi:MAG: hypothetical protein ACLQPH_18735 [Acidimicrobiales bacterium]